MFQGDAHEDAKRVGYWKSPGPKAGGTEEVAAAQGPMANGETDAVLAFIEAASIHMAWRGMALCRVCHLKMLGSCCMVSPDKMFIFPAQYEHYIVEHGVRPPEDFIAAALKWYEGEKPRPKAA